MKVRDIQKRAYKKAQAVVRRQYGPKCQSFEPACIVCQGNRLLRLSRRIPSFDEAHRRTFTNY